MFRILNPNDVQDLKYLSQMHHLRFKIFYEKLRWRNGLQIHSLMEFDQYDHNDAHYLVRINENDQVDACARLTPTNCPYLLGHSFQEYIETIEPPNTPDVFEVSRFCADPLTTPRNIAGQIMVAMLEYGLANNITKYVSLSDHKMIPVVKRFGWQANKIGSNHDTGTDISIALLYEVNEHFYEQVGNIVGLKQPLNMYRGAKTTEPSFNLQNYKEAA